MVPQDFDPLGLQDEVERDLDWQQHYKLCIDAPAGQKCNMAAYLKFGSFICGYNKQNTAMFCRMIEEAYLDM